MNTCDYVPFDEFFAGICHPDIHQVREEWGLLTFPMVPGHEIIGVVSAVGVDYINQSGERTGASDVSTASSSTPQPSNFGNFWPEATGTQ